MSHVDFESWLRMEETSDLKHELVAGQLFAMADALRRHNQLALAIASGVRDAALRDGCRAYAADMKLRVGNNGYYPDIMVVCEPSTDDRFEIAPCLVVEVLSPSTREIDQREKRTAYYSLPSVQAYVIAHPDETRIEVHQRLGDQWLIQPYIAGETVALPCPRVELEVDELYRGIE